MIPDEAVEAAAKIMYEHKDSETTFGAVARAALEAAAPLLTSKLAAEVAYQKARAAYFKYVPEIERDPEGVQELVEEMRAAREAFLNM